MSRLLAGFASRRVTHRYRPSLEALGPRLNPSATPLDASDVLVNQTTTSSQQAPDVARNDDGDYVVAWQSSQVSGGTRIFARIYYANGTSTGEFQVDGDQAAGGNSAPAVGIDDDGDVVVAWNGPSSLNPSYAGDIYAREFDATGSPLGSTFQVNTDAGGVHGEADVAMNGSGNYVVVWTFQTYATFAGGPHYIYSRQFGLGASGSSQVRLTPTDDQINPTVAIDDAGDYVVAWSSEHPLIGDEEYDITARLYDSSGTPVTSLFRVNSTTDSSQVRPSAAMDAAGDFIIAWQSYGQDGSGWGIYAQRYGSSGAATGGEFQVNATTTNDQSSPAASMDDSGDFVVAWQSYEQEGSSKLNGVYAKLYNSSGTALTGDVHANVTINNDQAMPSVAMDSSGNFVVVWTDNAQDGSGNGVYKRRFSFS